MPSPAWRRSLVLSAAAAAALWHPSGFGWVMPQWQRSPPRHHASRLPAFAASRAASPGEQRPLNILVVAEAGEGKSTLINKLVGKDVAEAGKRPGGVTKEVAAYPARVRDRDFVLWDMPGAGDKDVPFWVSLRSTGMTLDKAGGEVDGVLLLSSNPCRVLIGSKLVAQLLDLSFSSKDKWQSMALVGTKSDKYDDGDEENFKKHVLAEFNRNCNGQISKVCTVNKHDTSAVEDILVQIACESAIGDINELDAKNVARAVAQVNDLKPEEQRETEARIKLQLEEAKQKTEEAKQKTAVFQMCANFAGCAPVVVANSMKRPSSQWPAIP